MQALLKAVTSAGRGSLSPLNLQSFVSYLKGSSCVQLPKTSPVRELERSPEAAGEQQICCLNWSGALTWDLWLAWSRPVPLQPGGQLPTSEPCLPSCAQMGRKESYWQQSQVSHWLTYNQCLLVPATGGGVLKTRTSFSNARITSCLWGVKGFPYRISKCNNASLKHHWPNSACSCYINENILVTLNYFVTFF